MINFIKSLFQKKEEIKPIKKRLTQQEYDLKLAVSGQKHIDSLKEFRIDKSNIIYENKEDTLKKSRKLTFEFIPEKQNFINARSFLGYVDTINKTKFYYWKKIADEVKNKSNNTCLFCKNTKDLEAHEVWTFRKYKAVNNLKYFSNGKIRAFEDNQTIAVQQLKNIMCLCKECHGIAHINRQKEKIDTYKERYRIINNLNDIDEVEEDLDFYTNIKNNRNNIKYFLDVSHLERFNIIPTNLTKYIFDCHTNDFQKYLNDYFKNN